MIASLVRKRWFVISIATLLLFLIILVATPVLIKRLAINWLLDNGGDQVQFQDVDFNPFTGRLLLEALDVRVNNETTLSFASAGMDLAWRPLLSKQIKVQSVQLNGLHLFVDNRDMLKIGGIILPAQSGAETPPDKVGEASDWLSGIETLTLSDIHVSYRDSAIESEVDLERVQLTDLAQWAPEQPTHLEATGTVNGAGLTLSADLAPLAERPSYQGSFSLESLPLAGLAPLAKPALASLQGRLSLQSDFTVELSPGTVQVIHDGKIVLAELRLASEAGSVEAGSAQLNGKTDVTLNEEDVSVSSRGSLATANIKLVSDAASLDNQSIAWAGNSDIRLSGADKAMTLAAEGRLTLDELSASVQEPDLYVANKRLALQGKVAFNQAPDPPDIQLDSDIELEELAIATDQRRTALVDLQALNIDDLRVASTDDIRAASIEARALAVGRNADSGPDQQEPESLLHIARTAISQPSFSENVLAAESVQNESMKVRIHRNSEGKLTLLQLIDSIGKAREAPATDAETRPEQQAEETAQDTAPAETPAIVIKRLQIGGDSLISVVDESVEPTFETELLLEEARIEDLDSRKPEQSSALLINGKIDKHTSLSLKGSVQPFMDPPGMDLQGNISALDLPQLSSYTRDSLGVLLNSGTLNSEISLKTGNGSLEGLATLTLKQLELTGTGAKNSLQSRLPVPLDAALDTLRDKQNTIQLKIPVKGDIKDPKFSLNDAINQALAKGLQKGAFSYLKYALQPYGTLISVAQYAGEQISKVRLNPVEFAPGQSGFDASDREYLQKVAGVLKERPKIAIKLCGVAVQQDQPALQQQLLAQQPQQPPATTGAGQAKAPQQTVTIDEARFKELAQQRADAVKDYLVTQHGIPASQLVGCLPQLEIDKADAAPRTDLLI